MTTTWQPVPLPSPAFRGAIDDRNAQQLVNSGMDPLVVLRQAVRHWDQTIGTEPARQAVYAAFRGGLSAEDAGDANGVDGAWVSRQLDRRAKYFARIASMLGIGERTASATVWNDLEEVATRVKASLNVRDANPTARVGR